MINHKEAVQVMSGEAYELEKPETEVGFRIGVCEVRKEYLEAFDCLEMDIQWSGSPSAGKNGLLAIYY